MDAFTDFVAKLTPPPADNTGARILNGALVAPEIDERPDHFTDLGNALRLVRKHGANLKHVSGWGWLTWDDCRWQRDEKRVFNLAKDMALDLYRESEARSAEAQKLAERARNAAANGETETEAKAVDKHNQVLRRSAALASWAKTSQSAGRIAATIKLAESENAISAQSERFDSDPMLLNVQNGTLDLRTGRLRPHAREDLLTRLAPVAYDPAAACPTWDAFLLRIMGDSAALIDFLQRAVGHSLTGSVQEQCLFFLYGSGANGKSTFLKAILSLLGRDYAKQAAPELLTVGQDRHPTELADLAGVRFVASVEVTEGRRLAETLVKQLTGGDPVKGRFMRQDFFEYDPAFKIWLAANHKPVVKGTDFAIWRRIKLIPFTVTIPEAEQDKRLGEKLAGELPGILAWAVRGCMAWQREGLGIPAEVTQATEAYRAESDVLAGFLSECTTEGVQMQAQAGVLFKRYQTWAEANGIPRHEMLTNVKLSNGLLERGYDKYKNTSTGQMFYLGIGLRED